VSIKRAGAAGLVAATLGAIALVGAPGAQAAGTLGDLVVKGPKTVTHGKSPAYRVTVTNTGDAAADGLKVVASKGGTGSATGGTLAPGKSKVVKVNVTITGKAGTTVTVKFKATADSGPASVLRLKVDVRKATTLPGSDFPLYPPPQLPSVNG
jgi:hypothetical protein